jgi:hypothetical protein
MTAEQKRLLDEAISDLKFIVQNMNMHVAAREAVARNIARLETIRNRE